MKDLRARTISALLWSVGSKMLVAVSSVSIAIVLARLLHPSDFGLLAMVEVFIGLASIFIDLGLTAALIQRQNLEEPLLSSVFWINVGMGAVFTVALIAAAPLIANFYAEPMLTVLVPVCSLNFVLSSLSAVHRVLLVKQLKFKVIALRDTLANFSAGAVAILLAYLGFGVWSLVGQTLLAVSITCAVFWTSSSWRPRMVFDFSAVREIMRFSYFNLSNTIVSFAANSTDNLLVGITLGASELGIYGRARSLISQINQLTGVVGQVMFPSLSLIQDDRGRVAQIYLRAVQSIALVSFPALTGLAVTAEQFVNVLLGAKWLAVAPLLQLFCCSGMAQSLSALCGSIYLSQGRAGLQLRVSLITKSNTIACVAIGSQWGLDGIALGYVGASLVNSVVTISTASRLVGLNYTRVMLAAAPAIANCAAMALVLQLAETQIAGIGDLAQLVVLVLIGAAYFVSTSLLLDLPSARELATIARVTATNALGSKGKRRSAE